MSTSETPIDFASSETYAFEIRPEGVAERELLALAEISLYSRLEKLSFSGGLLEEKGACAVVTKDSINGDLDAEIRKSFATFESAVSQFATDDTVFDVNKMMGALHGLRNSTHYVCSRQEASIAPAFEGQTFDLEVNSQIAKEIYRKLYPYPIPDQLNYIETPLGIVFIAPRATLVSFMEAAHASTDSTIAASEAVQQVSNNFGGSFLSMGARFTLEGDETAREYSLPVIFTTNFSQDATTLEVKMNSLRHEYLHLLNNYVQTQTPSHYVEDYLIQGGIVETEQMKDELFAIFLSESDPALTAKEALLNPLGSYNYNGVLNSDRSDEYASICLDGIVSFRRLLHRYTHAFGVEDNFTTMLTISMLQDFPVIAWPELVESLNENSSLIPPRKSYAHERLYSEVLKMNLAEKKRLAKDLTKVKRSTPPKEVTEVDT